MDNRSGHGHLAIKVPMIEGCLLRSCGYHWEVVKVLSTSVFVRFVWWQGCGGCFGGCTLRFPQNISEIGDTSGILGRFGIELVARQILAEPHCLTYFALFAST